MGHQELLLETIKDWGDPDELVNNEDLIVLRLEHSSPSKRFLIVDIGINGDTITLELQSTGFRHMPGIQWQPEVFGCSVRRKQGVLAVNSIFEHCQIRAEERAHFGTSAQQKLNIEYRELPPTILAFNKPTFQSGLNTRSVEKQEHRELPDNQS
ncbi:hypothetical protein MRX96_058228 [Rhipicephalus microplus]